MRHGMHITENDIALVEAVDTKSRPLESQSIKVSNSAAKFAGNRRFVAEFWAPSSMT